MYSRYCGFNCSVISSYESESLNVTNREAFFVSMLLDLSLDRSECSCYKNEALGDGHLESRDVDGPECCVSDIAMNQVKAHIQKTDVWE